MEIPNEVEALFYYDTENPAPEMKLTEDTLEYYAPHLPDTSKILPRNLVIPEEQAAQVADLEMMIGETVNSYMMRFILGESDIEENWDAYLSELEAVGLSEYLDLYQQCYDNMQ